MLHLRWHHVVGLVAGAVLGAVVAALSGTFGYSLALNDGLFWGGVIGGILAGVPEFAQAGAVLTRSERPMWNLLVGLVGSLVFLGVVVGLTSLIFALLF
jgi:hypothetical protein